jgi:hypothetical protein
MERYELDGAPDDADAGPAPTLPGQTPLVRVDRGGES